MKITNAQVSGFGVWNDMTANELSPEVTLFYGPNEAGKTTLMQFVRAVLYGFSDERRHLYFPPVFGGTPGGVLNVQNHSGDFTIERSLEDDDQTVTGRVVVGSENGSRQGQHLLNVLLSGIDESIFNNVFAVGIHELQELATLNDTQAAEQLYNLASGVDRVSLVEVMRHLQSERVRIWGDDGAESELGTLLSRRSRLHSETETLERQTRRWIDLAHQQRQLVGEITDLEKKIGTYEFDARTVEIAIQIRDKWNKRSDLARQLNRIGHVELFPEGCVGRLDELNQTISEQRELLKPIKSRRLELRREMAAQPINRALWDRSCRIEAMCEHGPWLASLDREIAALDEELEASEVQLLTCDEELAALGGVVLAEGVVVTDRTFQTLLPSAHVVREALRKREIARTHRKKTKQDEAEALNELEYELQGHAETFEESLERAGNSVKLLRRRIQIEEHIDAMQDQSEELEQDNHVLLDSQFQRVRLFIWVGILFMFGGAMLLSAFFPGHMNLSLEVRWAVGLLGAVVLLVSIAWKSVAEQTAEDELNDSFRRRETLERELGQAIDEREEVDRLLPTGSGPFSMRLASAENVLKALEEKVPLQTDRKEAERRTYDSKRYSSNVEEELKEAKTRWKRALRNAGLPETLSPKHVKQLSVHYENRSKIQTRLDQQRERREKLVGDRDILVDRLQQLNSDIGIELVSEEPQVQLSQLATALSGQREMVDRRRELQRAEKEVRRELAGQLKALRRLMRSREALFSEARVTDEEALRERAETLQLIAELTERKDSLTEQISAIIGSHCSAADFEEELTENTAEELELRWNELITKLQDSQAMLGQLHQRHGEVKQEMKSLAEDQRLAAAKFELECLDEKIQALAEEWRGLAVSLRMLEDIRESYEAERQPETLGEASIYLQTLTDGKYTRVWTPLGQNELRVDDANGQPMALDVLSRGTREAIFLSLRLALVAAYGRRGVTIPMILDDVLVNLDHKRAKAAVEVLCDFAKEGRQLLFFTCHEHIKAMFMTADVDIRVLPTHGVPGTEIRRLEIVEPEPVDTLLAFEPPVEDEEIPVEIWDEGIVEPEEEKTEEEAAVEIQLEEVELEEEPEEVEVELEEEFEDEAEEVAEEVFAELEDNHAFDDGSWWWEPSRRLSTEEEETAA